MVGWINNGMEKDGDGWMDKDWDGWMGKNMDD